MRIAVLSDIHDHIDRLRAALARLDELGGAGALLCCGDLCAPFMVDELLDGFDGPIHVVFGNNDGDRFRLGRAAAGRDRFRLHGEFAEPSPEPLDGTRVVLHHFPEVGRAVAAAGRHDLVCWGHTHRWSLERFGSTVALNPGEIMGRLGTPTFAVYDTATGSVERHEP